MPVLRLVTRATTLETYQAVMGRLDMDRQHPLGLIMHGMAEVEDGKVRIAQVWEDEEYARDFLTRVLEPELVAEGVPPPEHEMMVELHHLVTP